MEWWSKHMETIYYSTILLCVVPISRSWIVKTCLRRLHTKRWSAYFLKRKQGGIEAHSYWSSLLYVKVLKLWFMNPYHASSWQCQKELENNLSCLSYKILICLSPVKLYVATASSEEDMKGSDVATCLSTYVYTIYIKQSQSQSSSHVDSRQWLPLTEVERRSQGPILRSVVKVRKMLFDYIPWCILSYLLDVWMSNSTVRWIRTSQGEMHAA